MTSMRLGQRLGRLLLLLEHANPTQDGVERRAQLVRQRADEVVFHARGALGFGSRGALAREEQCPLLLGALLLGDIARDGHELLHPSRGRRVANGRDDDVPPFGSALGGGAKGVESAFALGDGIRNRLLGDGGVIVPELRPEFAFVAVIVLDLHQRQSGAIAQHDPAVGLEDLDAVARVVEDAAIEALDLLQVGGGGQGLALRGGARGHLGHQGGATALEAAFHRDGDESQSDGHQETDHRETQRTSFGEFRLAGALREQRRFRGAHLGREDAEVVHQTLAEAAGDPSDRGGRIAVAVQLEDVGHLVEPADGQLRQAARACLLRRIVGDEGDEAGGERPRVAAGAGIRLEEGAVFGQQKPAMIRFGVDEPRHQPIDRIEHLVRVLDERGRRREPGVLVDRQSAAEQQDGDGHEERPSPGGGGRQIATIACLSDSAHVKNSRAGGVMETESIRSGMSKRFANGDKLSCRPAGTITPAAGGAVHSTISSGLPTYARSKFCCHG